MKTGAKKIGITAKIVIAVAVLFCIVKIVSYRIEYSHQKAYQETLKEEIEYYSAEVDELENKCNAPFDKEYIISVAKEKLDYCFPEEVFFIVN